MDDLLTALLTTVKVKIPKILLEHEVNRQLSDLIDQTRRLGLSVEQYLTSTGKNADILRREYEDQAVKSLTLQLSLEKIADTQGVIVSDVEIDTAIPKAKTGEEKKSLSSQRYYLATILRRQKTLDFLASI